MAHFTTRKLNVFNRKDKNIKTNVGLQFLKTIKTTKQTGEEEIKYKLTVNCIYTNSYSYLLLACENKKD